MDGVKPLSVGRGTLVRGATRMGCIDRIRIKPQPALSIHNGSRLGCGRQRSLVEHVHPQKMGASGDPYIHFGLADRILDRASLLPAAPSKFTVCRGLFDFDHLHYSDQHTSQKHTTLFYKKRGV